MTLSTASVLFVNHNLLEQPSQTFALKLNFLISQLNLLRYVIKKISIVLENKNVIIGELEVLTKLYDVVLIIGDLRNGEIFHAVASVSGQELQRNVELSRIIGTSCALPEAVKLLKADGSKFPIIYFQRIFILEETNIEVLFLNALNTHLEHYHKKEPLTKIFNILVNGNKRTIFEELNKLNIQVLNENNGDLLTASVTSESLEHLVESEKILRTALGSNILSSYDKSLLENSIYGLEEKHIKQALEDIEKCFCLYGPENVFVSFNGGKDCTVLLHLILRVQTKKFSSYKKPTLCLYVRSDNTFKEQDDFIKQCEIFYNLEIVTVPANIKEALALMLKMKPSMKACFMGSRRSDPYCGDLSVFKMSDPDWPQIMRVSPLLDWHYSDIWDYLLYYKVPYCKLYDMGYTSLGSALNTIRNPNLIYQDADGKETYLPAYKMLNETKERSGRNIPRPSKI